MPDRLTNEYQTKAVSPQDTIGESDQRESAAKEWARHRAGLDAARRRLDTATERAREAHGWSSGYGGGFTKACKAFGVDVKKLEEKIKADAKAKKAEKKKPKAAKAKKGKKK